MREAHVALDETGYEAMGIAELVSLCRDAGLRELEELACHGTGAVVRVDLEGRLDEKRLSNLEYVEKCERVVGTEDGHAYIVAFTAPELPESVARAAEDLVGTCDPEVGKRGSTVSLVGPQEAIADAVGEYETAGVPTDLRRLGSYGGGSDPLEALTDRQEAVIRTAYEVGYYEVPREASTEDVAAELDVDPSTVTEHLQRAERNLLERLL